jgi:hypothetical protein
MGPYIGAVDGSTVTDMTMNAVVLEAADVQAGEPEGCGVGEGDSPGDGLGAAIVYWGKWAQAAQIASRATKTNADRLTLDIAFTAQC